MDLFVYYDYLGRFSLLRMASSVLTVGVLALLFSDWGKKHYRVLRMAWYWIP